MIPGNEFKDFATRKTNKSIRFDMPSGLQIEYEWPQGENGVASPTSWHNMTSMFLVDKWGHEYIIRGYDDLYGAVRLESVATGRIAWLAEEFVRALFSWRDRHILVPAQKF